MEAVDTPVAPVVTPSPPMMQVSAEEAVSLGAVDGGLFGRFFFPRAFKQDAPPCHKEMDELLDDMDSPLVSFMIPRGWAKTTKTRVYIARRISYGISRTILIIGKSQGAAVKTLEWIKRSVEHNQRWSGTFGLEKGSRWSGEDIEIIHHHFQDENGGPLRIRILAYGMTGSVRGVNIDDCRPDLIVVDDPCDEENTATTEQRKKIADLFFGSILRSLAPPSEAPHAKMVLLQTVLNPQDLVSLCEKDSHWKSLKISCFDIDGNSTWGERYPTKALKEEKQGYIDRGMLSLWMREMESACIHDDLAAFKEEHLRFWDQPENGVGGALPSGGYTFLSIDPVPPPKDETNVKITARHDNAVISVVRVSHGAVYVAEQEACKSPDVMEFINQIFLMARIWKTSVVVIETILFQRVIASVLKKEMVLRREYLQIIPIEDKRSKPARIRQEIARYSSNRQLYVSTEMTGFLGEYWAYPFVQHDDHLDSLAIGLMHITPHVLEASYLEGEYSRVIDDEAHLLGDWRADI
jgi:hypothetical protein